MALIEMSSVLSSAQISAVNKVWPICLALLIMFVPAFWWLLENTWSKDNQAHGPIVFSIAMWLIYRSNGTLSQLIVEGKNNSFVGWIVLLIGCLTFVIGKSLIIDLLLAGSFIIVVIGILLIIGGWAAVRAVWFPLFFLIFMLPLPSSFVSALTLPMKTLVSYFAENILFQLGYPVSRSGVIIQIGQYQMLVADACAGLHTLFTLEAIGLLYLNLMGYKNAIRNLIVALMVVPISLAANTVRVIVLILITYHFGDEAGQGFLHGFAGIVLFGVALFLLMSFDGLLGIFLKKIGIHDAGLKKSK